MIRIHPVPEIEHRADARLAAEPPTGWSGSVDGGGVLPSMHVAQRAQNFGDGAAGALETAVCRMAVIVALWFGH